MMPPEKLGCHHTAFKQKCRKLVSDGVCGRWMQVLGQHPQTGEQVNRWDCVDNWTPILLIENSQLLRHAAASSDKATNETRGFRNDMRQVNGLPEIALQEHPAITKF